MSLSDTWLPRGAFKPRRYRPGGIGNWSGHLPFAHDLVQAVRPGLLVELGTHLGESYFGFCQAVSENGLSCKCYAVDTWVGELHETAFSDVNAYNDANYPSFSFLLRTTVEEAREKFSEASIDILHIDGPHTYEAVRHEFERWFPAVKPGGIILVHDISARHADFDVWKFWEELEKLGEQFAFSHNWGLGVFRKPGGERNNPFLSELFSGSEQTRNHFRYFYSLCGRNLEYEHMRDLLQRAEQTSGVLQIYPETKDGYSSEVRYQSAFKTKSWQHVTLEVLSGSARGGLRFDLTDSPGVIDLAGLSVRKAVNNELLFSANGAEELAVLAVSGTLTRLEGNGNTEFCRYISSGIDPQLTLTLDPKLTDQPLIVDVWVRADADLSLLLPLLTQAQNEAKPEPPAELHATITELEAQTNEQARQIDLLREERESLKSSHLRMQSELYMLKRDLITAGEEKDKFAVLSAELARLTAAHEDLLKSRQNLEATLQGIEASTSWRLTSPIRRFMERRRS